MNLKVLLIDQEESTRDLVLKFLQEESIPIKTCETVKQAFSVLEKETFSILIVDISVSEHGGVKFIKKIQNDGFYTPIIAISGSRDLTHAQEAVRLNIFDYIVKPLKKPTIIEIVKKAHNQFLLNYEKEILQKQKDEYRDTLEMEVKEQVVRIKESEQKYRNLVEQSILGVAIILDEEIVYCNTRFSHIFGYKNPTEITGLSFNNFILPQKYKLVQEAIEDCIAGKKNKSSINFPALKNDKIVYIQAWFSTVEYKEKPALQIVLIDNTDQELAREREKKYELELLKEHRLAAIGQLTSGIAHNLNTPISIIQGNAELLSLKYPDSKEIDMILRQTKNMAEAIHTISAKGKSGLNDGISEININELITREIDFLQSNLFFKHYVKCILNLDSTIPVIEGKYTEYSQSISAIIQNSLDAMYKRENARLVISTAYKDNIISLRIKDNGSGMDEHTTEHLFEPFYTTKPSIDEKLDDEKIPRGTGLGLTIAHNLLKKNDIQISVLSKLNIGSEFILKIPVKNEN